MTNQHAKLAVETQREITLQQRNTNQRMNGWQLKPLPPLPQGERIEI